MRKYWLIALLLMTACQTSTGNPSAQASKTPAPQASASSPPQMAGGYTEQATDSPVAKSIKRNAQNLLNQKYPGAAIELGALTAYATQVVAGINHQLEVEYSDATGRKGKLKLVVFQDLKGSYSLSEDDYPAKP